MKNGINWNECKIFTMEGEQILPPLKPILPISIKLKEYIDTDIEQYLQDIQNFKSSLKFSMSASDDFADALRYALSSILTKPKLKYGKTSRKEQSYMLKYFYENGIKKAEQQRLKKYVYSFKSLYKNKKDKIK